MKKVQIDYELFRKLIFYHLGSDDQYEEDIRNGLEEKLDALVRHELYTKYKTAPSEEEQEKARQSEKEQLAAVMERYGIEWEHLGTHEKHLSVLDYKKQEREKEVAALGAKIEQKQIEFDVLSERVLNYDNGNESGERMVFGWNTILWRSGICTGKDTGIKQTGRVIVGLLLVKK